MKRLDEIRQKAEELYDTKNLGGFEAIIVGIILILFMC